MIIDRTVTISYENERGFSVPLTPPIGKNLFNGTFYVLNASENLPNDISSERQVGWHGENVQNFWIGARTIDIDGFIIPDSKNPEIVHGYKRSLEKAFNPSLNGILTYDRNWSAKQFHIGCIPASLPEWSVNNGILNFRITLKAFSPFWQRTTETVRLSFTQPNIFFPMGIPPVRYVAVINPKNGKNYFGLKKKNLQTEIENIGDVETGFKLVFLANGELKNPSLTNLDTGQSLKIIVDMEKGDRIEIVSYPKEKSITVKDDAKGFKYLAPGSQFFYLPVGVTNIKFETELNVTLLDVLIQYSPMYLGAEN